MPPMTPGITKAAGDLIRLPMTIPHGIYNRSRQTVTALGWVTPARKLYDLFWAIHSMKQQNPDAAWAAYKGYFENQKDVTPENVKDKGLEYAGDKKIDKAKLVHDLRQ